MRFTQNGRRRWIGRHSDHGHDPGLAERRDDSTRGAGGARDPARRRRRTRWSRASPRWAARFRPSRRMPTTTTAGRACSLRPVPPTRSTNPRWCRGTGWCCRRARPCPFRRRAWLIPPSAFSRSRRLRTWTRSSARFTSRTFRSPMRTSPRRRRRRPNTRRCGWRC